MKVISKLNRFTNDVLQQFGYEIRRTHRENPINLLELVISHLVLIGRRPSFIQVGANDGLQSDPLAKSIREHELAGLVIEPQSDVFELLQENERHCPGVQCVNAAIDRCDGARSMFRYRKDPNLPAWANGLCSFERSHLAKFRELSQFSRLIEEVRVETISVRSLLKNSGLSDVGLLQIDTEGYDFEIIKMFFAEHVFPTVVNYEHRHLSGYDSIACEELLRDNGYKYVRYGRDALAMRSVMADTAVTHLVATEPMSSTYPQCSPHPRC